jgi:hypothetical protein
MEGEQQNQHSNVGWYPSAPGPTIPVFHLSSKHIVDDSTDVCLDPFAETNVKFLPSNNWVAIPKEKREQVRRHKIKGVEVRRLPKNHFLSGQHGLFATEKFSRFDIIGEYTGKIVADDVNGHYVAALEDKGHDDSLGIDAEFSGNEMRFINSYLNIAFKANVSMRTAYVNTYPHIIIVCTEDIFVGDEILLDYGEAYTQAYLTPKPKIICGGEISMEIIRDALPFLNESSSDEEDT